MYTVVGFITSSEQLCSSSWPGLMKSMWSCTSHTDSGVFSAAAKEQVVSRAGLWTFRHQQKSCQGISEVGWVGLKGCAATWSRLKSPYTIPDQGLPTNFSKTAERHSSVAFLWQFIQPLSSLQVRKLSLI